MEMNGHGNSRSQRQALDDQSHTADSYFHIQSDRDSDSLLRVQVESSIQKTIFYVPVSLMLQREVEMQHGARQARIPRDRWSCSRLFRLWKEKASMEQEITLVLRPEASMNEYSSLRWHPWLTTCIRAYYNSGSIKIPEESTGSDILLALEYFGILTTNPDPFVFESYGAYERVKLWSDYFTLRNIIVEWLIADLKVQGEASWTWVVSKDPSEVKSKSTMLHVEGRTATVLSGGLEKLGYKVPCKILHGVFSDRLSKDPLTKEVPIHMRQDLCKLLSQYLPSSNKVSFRNLPVKIVRKNGRATSETRPVLTIEQQLDRRSSNRSTGGGSGKEVPNKKSHSADESSKMSFLGLDKGGEKIQTYKDAHPEIFGSEKSNESAGRAKVKSTSHPSTSSGENRDPSRSSPTSEDRRASHDAAVPALSDKEFLKQIDEASPVNIINTAFGDLRSVTSGLSNPFDESVIADDYVPNIVPSPSRAKSKDQQPRTQPAPSNNSLVEQIREDMGFNDMSSPASGGSAGNDDDDNWGSWFASVCDAVLPGALQGINALSPTNAQSPRTADTNTVATTPTDEGNRAKSPRTTPTNDYVATDEKVDSTCSFEDFNVFGSAIEDGKAKEENPPILTDDFPAIAMEHARSLGSQVSMHVDDLLKVAFSEDDPPAEPTTVSEPTQRSTAMVSEKSMKRESKSIPPRTYARSNSQTRVKDRLANHRNSSRSYGVPVANSMNVQQGGVARSRNVPSAIMGPDLLPPHPRSKLRSKGSRKKEKGRDPSALGVSPSESGHLTQVSSLTQPGPLSTSSKKSKSSRFSFRGRK